jgi:NAD(P)-dependent dehydrogenase (short-subunit alcohol dehydrogenase family)
MAASQAFIVTGGNTGLGFHCASFLSLDRDSLVVIGCRDPKSGEEAARKLRRTGGRVEVLPLDLASQASIHAFVDAFRQLAPPPLSGLVCNAGMQNIGVPTRTAEGYETTFAVNHLGHYLLARLLLPAMAPNGRIVFVSSGTHDPAQKSGLPEPRYESAEAVAHDFEPGTDAGRRRYSTSKLCNIFCCYEFARRLASAPDPRLQSIRVNAFDPGLMPGTGLARTYPAVLRFAWSYVLPIATLFMRNVHRPAKSGERLALLAAGPQGAVTGRYFSDGDEIRSSELSYDSARALELWEASARMTQLPSEL